MLVKTNCSRLVKSILMQIWAFLNYRNSDIATITIVTYYRDVSHYRYYRSTLFIVQYDSHNSLFLSVAMKVTFCGWPVK